MTNNIQQALRYHFGNNEYKLSNVYMFNWECDFFCITKQTNYCIEVEIKVSRSDFLADFKKVDKHKLFKRRVETHVCLPGDWGGSTNVKLEDGTYHKAEYSNVYFHDPLKSIPNRFYYACPDNMLGLEDIPSYAGLLYLRGSFIHVVKNAPLLHRVQHDKTKQLLSKYYSKFHNVVGKVYDLKNDLYGHIDEEGRKKIDQFISQFHYNQ